MNKPTVRAPMALPGSRIGASLMLAGIGVWLTGCQSLPPVAPRLGDTGMADRAAGQQPAPSPAVPDAVGSPAHQEPSNGAPGSSPAVPGREPAGTAAPPAPTAHAPAVGPAAPHPRGVSPHLLATEDTWGQLRRGFAIDPLPHPLAERHARRFAEGLFFERRAARLQRYLPLIVQEVQARGLPLELALIPLVESALDPHARSPVGALGTWQFMRPTAHRFELRMSHLVDDRKNLLAATRAALDYLQTLHKQFGDWHLAMAAYNWGEGRVQRAVQRARARGMAPDFSGLAAGMPAETRHYVPQVDALRRLIDDPEAWGIRLPPLPLDHALETASLTADIDLSLVLRLSGLDEREFLALNPAVRPPLVLASATPQLLLPAAAAQRLRQALAVHAGPQSSWRVVRLDRATPLPVLARRHGVSETVLRQDNGIAPGHKPLAGSVLLVRSLAPPGSRVDERIVAAATLATAPDLVRTTTTVRRGETLAAVARRTGVAPQALARWNGLAGARARGRLITGRTLELWVPRARAARPSLPSVPSSQRPR